MKKVYFLIGTASSASGKTTFTMKHYLPLLVTVLIIFSLSCSSNKQESEIRELTQDFPQTINITGQVLNIPSDSLDDCQKMKIIGNFCYIFSKSGDKFITTIDLDNGNIQKLIKKGRGPNEYSRPNFIDSDTCFIIGQENYATLSCKYAKILNDKDSLAIYYDNISTNDSIFEVPMLILSKENILYFPFSSLKYQGFPFRYVLYSSLGDSLTSIGDMYPLQCANEDIKDVRLANWNGHHIKLVGSDLFAYFSMAGCYIEFYNATNWDECVISRYIYSKPRYEKRDLGNGMMVAGIADECIYGFVDATASKNEYYALYNGKTSYEMKACNYNYTALDIYQYSAKGKPQNHFKLDREVNKIAVSSDGKYLYAFSPNPESLEPEIVRYALP